MSFFRSVDGRYFERNAHVNENLDAVNAHGFEIRKNVMTSNPRKNITDAEETARINLLDAQVSRLERIARSIEK